jgi:uroporphyrinogen decarboxylase
MPDDGRTEMTRRERYRRIMHFDSYDRVPVFTWNMEAVAGMFWDSTVERWYEEGLSRDVLLHEYFGFERQESISFRRSAVPGFPVEVRDETDEYITKRRGDGCVVRERKHHRMSYMPEYVDYPIKSRKDWLEYKKRLDPKSSLRRTPWFEDRVREWNNRTYVLTLRAGSLFGRLRFWLGPERLLYAFCDEPEWVHEMLEYHSEFLCEVARPMLEAVEFDGAQFWEDMAFNNGPFISPKMFREFLLPAYKPLTDLIRKHGIDVVWVDSDGDMNELVEPFLEAGINGFYPLETRANVDPVELRKRYGRDVLLLGGIDKWALAGTKEDVKKEVMSKVPYLASEGGYIPNIDHSIPPNVPLENYEYYLELIRSIKP